MAKQTEPVRLVTVGMGGYGQYLYNILRTQVDPETYEIVAGVDPFAKKAYHYRDYVEENIPVFDQLQDAFDELPKSRRPEVAIIASPIPFHAEQCRIALENKCLVLCEKPLTARWEDSLELAKLSAQYETVLGVGFQWSYYPSVLGIKQDILSGVFGKVLETKALVVWPRTSNYYVGWKGQLKSPTGEWILDSVVSNATAHYLHNLLFLLGDSSDEAALPAEIAAMTYRANPIPSFDTISLTGRFSSGAKLLYLATHAAEESIEPIFKITCEEAVISCDMNDPEPHFRARFNDGQIKAYGPGTNSRDDAEKIRTFIQRARDPHTPIPCQAETVIPHLKICNATSDQVETVNFPSELITQGSLRANPAFFVTSLAPLMKEAWDRSVPLGALDVEGANWIVEEQLLEIER